MTCSVFKEENESNVTYFKEKLGLELLSQSYQLLNYQDSDVLFIAVLRKS
jgi:16S rRNA C967 or C1407 C5-methylase (RsmB/RsmF family)